MAPEMVRPGGVHLQNPWQINSKNNAQIEFLATRACLFEILGAFLSALILDTLFIGHPPPKKRQSRETVLQNWSLFASSGAFELAPFFWKRDRDGKARFLEPPGPPEIDQKSIKMRVAENHEIHHQKVSIFDHFQ